MAWRKSFNSWSTEALDREEARLEEKRRSAMQGTLDAYAANLNFAKRLDFEPNQRLAFGSEVRRSWMSLQRSRGKSSCH